MVLRIFPTLKKIVRVVLLSFLFVSCLWSLLACFVSFVSFAFLSFRLVLLFLSVGSFLAPFLFFVFRPSFLFCLFFVCHVTMTDVSFGSKLSMITYGLRLQRAYGFMSKSPCAILPDATQSLAAPFFGDV